MNRSSKQSMVWLLIMTLIVMTFNGLPISAHPLSERYEKTIKENYVLKMNDYVQQGTDGKLPILWRVIYQDKEVFFLCQDRWLQYINDKSNKNNKFNKDKAFEDIEEWLEDVPKATNLLEEDNINLSDVAIFYVPANDIAFKIGEGTFERPYILYTNWKEEAQIKAQDNQVILYNVQLIGNKDPWQIQPTIEVGDRVQSFVDIKYDAKAHTLTYELVETIKADEKVTFAYTLPLQATSAIAKTDQQQVLVYMPITTIVHNTVPEKPQPIVLIQDLQDEWVEVGQPKTLTVKAKGEGKLTFTWYKDGQWLKSEVKDSFNRETSSNYTLKTVGKNDAGTYKVEVIGLSARTETSCQLNIINHYEVRTSMYPVDAGNIVDNSSAGDGFYDYDEWVTLTATPKENYRFVNWTENGKEVSHNQTYSFQIRQDRNLIANFKWIEPEYVPQYTISVTVTPKDSGTVRGDYTYNKGEHATLKARAKEGYIFESWTENGEVISRDEEYSFTVKEDRRLKANFEKEEKDFKEEWRSLSSKQQRSIRNQFEEYLPYTTLEESLTLTQLDHLTKGYFTKEQLRELSNNLDLLESIDIYLDWEEINLKKVSYVNFRDLFRSHWAYENIIALAKRGIVTGYPNQTFKPSQPLTVADTFTFLDRMLLVNEQTDMKQPRSTVEEIIQDKGHWAFNHMASIGSKLNDETLEMIGIMGNNCYVSRGFLAQVLYEVTDGKLSKTKPLVQFTDTRYSAYKEGINYCIRTGLLEGTSDYMMEPDKAVTRAEMMTILQRLDNALN